MTVSLTLGPSGYVVDEQYVAYQSRQQLAAGGFVSGPKLQKIRRAIKSARAFNPWNATPITSAQCTVTSGPPQVAGANAVLPQFWNPNPATTGPAYFNMYGGNWIQYNAVPGYLPLSNNTVVNAGTPFPVYSQIGLEWMSDAPILSTGTTQGTYLLLVDGAPLISTAGIATDATGSSKTIGLDWTVGGTITDPLVTRKPRRYMFVTAGVNWINRVSTAAADRVWAPNRDDEVRCYVIGDSYTNDTSEPLGMLPHLGLTYGWTSRLGFKDVWRDGVGGSGYTVAGSGRFGYQAIAGAIAANPDVIVIPFGINDNNQPASVLIPLVTQLLTGLRAGLPGVPIIHVGPWAENTGPSAGAIAVENAIAAAIAALNDPLIAFVPNLTDPAGSWVFGTGNSSSGTGNVPLYHGTSGIHPSQAGHGYYSLRMAEGVGNALLRMSGASN